MIRNLIRTGTITNINNQFGILRAQVVDFDQNEPEDVVLLNTYGQNAYPPLGSFCLILTVYGHSENKYAIPFNKDDAPILQNGESVIYNHFGSQIYLKANGDIDITANTTKTSGDIDNAGVYKVGGIQVINGQSAAIPDATGGSVVDTEARAAINALMAALRIQGILAT